MNIRCQLTFGRRKEKVKAIRISNRTHLVVRVCRYIFNVIPAIIPILITCEIYCRNSMGIVLAEQHENLVVTTFKWWECLSFSWLRRERRDLGLNNAM